MALSNPIRDDLAAAGLLPDALDEHSSVNSRGEAVDATATRRSADLDPETTSFLQDGGWSSVSIKGDGGGGGLTSHRGVLHPDEYVDESLLQLMIERRLGFTYEQIRSVYRQGPLSSDKRELRGKIDARLLALSRSGGNMAELGRALGLPIRSSGECRIIESALARARKDAGESRVPEPRAGDGRGEEPREAAEASCS